MAMTLRLNDAESDALRRAAEAEGLSMQEVAHKAIRQYTAGWAERRDTYMTQWAARNESLLRRLGE